MSDKVKLGVGNGLVNRPDPYAAVPKADEKFPLQLTLGETVRWYWGVKRWELTTDFKVVWSDSAAGDTYLQTVELTGGDAGGRTGLTEDDLFFEANDQGAGYRSPAIGEYYPAIYIFGLIRNNGTPDQLKFSSDPTDNGGSPTSSMTATIDGKNITLYLWIDLSLEPFGNPGVMSVTATQFDLDPVEFWPYAAKDASPLYNTTTGAQLQSPLN
jgi:hypothetical protein